MAGVELARWLAIPAHILLMLGVVTLFLTQATETGRWGLVGALLAFSGMAIFVGYVVGGWEAAVPEPRLGPIGGILWIVGLAILAIATWRGGVLPGATGVLWLSGAVVYAAGVPTASEDASGAVALVGAAMFAAGFAWAGIAILAID